MVNYLEQFIGEVVIGFQRERLEERGYSMNDRKFKDIWRFIEKTGLFRRSEFPNKNHDIVYSGAEHRGRPKFPNITVLPNIDVGYDTLQGSTYGHQHTQSSLGDNRRFQEIYEFLGYGAMLLRNNSGTCLHILKPGEKVLVGTDDNMTIFNLDSNRLVTLDYANPEMNSADKDLENEIGSLMLITHMEFSEANTTVFNINPSYVELELLKCEKEVRRDGYVYWGSVRVQGEKSKFLVGVGDTGLGSEIYKTLRQGEMTEEEKREHEDLIRQGLGVTAAFFCDKFQVYSKQFEKLGISIKYGGNIPEDLREAFSPPLCELILMKNKALFDNLRIV